MKRKIIYALAGIAIIWVTGLLVGLATGQLRIEFGKPEKEDLSHKTDEGPYVIHEGGKLSINYYRDSVHLRARGSAKDLKGKKFTVINDSGKMFPVYLKSHINKEPSTYPPSEKLLVVSDIEGNFYALREILQSSGVVDKDLVWAYGNGSLVIVGDLVDRGLDVTPCLWLIYKLEEEAKRAGGRVHYILGNHETMIMAGDARYVRKKYHELAQVMNLDISKTIFGNSGEFGIWLRTKNIIEKVGSTLFVHGGISSEMLEAKISLESINETVRKYYGMKSEDLKESDDAKLILGEDGPLWYRGMAQEKLTPEEINQILSFYGVKKIVFGHSIFEKIRSFNENKLIGIDLIQPTTGKDGPARALLIEDDVYYEVSSDGKKLLIDGN